MNVTTMCKLIENNKVVSIDDYQGKVYWNNNIVDKEDLSFLIREAIDNNEEVPTYIVTPIPIENFIRIDLERIVEDKCDDGYEDMKEYFNYDDKKFVEAQRLINEWLEHHSEANTVYYECKSFVVDIQSLIDKYKK